MNSGPGPSSEEQTNPKDKEDVGKDLGRLKVFVRVKPSLGDPAFSGSSHSLRLTSNTAIAYSFNHVFWPSETQADVFTTCGLPMLKAAVNGYNACLFAYGQTGTGKTHSIMGSDSTYQTDSTGIIPRFCQGLLLETNRAESSFHVDMSFLEFYNEKMFDLIVPKNGLEKKPLKLREHPVSGPYVENLSWHHVKDFDDAKILLNLGNSRRATAATANNERSSRSHCVVQFSISKRTEGSLLLSKVSFVDLAGSERVCDRTDNQIQYKEGLSINKTLLTLGKIINSLHDANCYYAPFRDTKLTWLLKESLGGNSCTSMLATVSLDVSSAEESLATLRYACKARRIVNKVFVNEDHQHALIRKLRMEVEKLKSLKKSVTTDDKVQILIMHQKAVEKKLQIELKKLSTDLEAAEKRRIVLEDQTNYFYDNIKLSDVDVYQSNFLKNLQFLLDDSYQDDGQAMNNDDRIECFSEFKTCWERLHKLCSSKSDPVVFNDSILPLLLIIKNASNKLDNVLLADS